MQWKCLSFFGCSNFYLWLCDFFKISDPANKESLEQIQRGIFILCLDKSYNLDKCSDPSSVTANMMNHGGGINQNGGNRWYDKPVVVRNSVSFNL